MPWSFLFNFHLSVLFPHSCMNARYVGQNQSNWLSVARFCSTWRADQIIIRLHSILLHWLQCPAKTFSFLITLLSSAPLIRSGSSNRKQGNPGIKEDYSQEFNKLIHLPVCCPCCVKWLLSIEDDGGESKSSHFQLSTGKRLKEIIQTFSKTSHIYFILYFSKSKQQHIQFNISAIRWSPQPDSKSLHMSHHTCLFLRTDLS